MHKYHALDTYDLLTHHGAEHEILHAEEESDDGATDQAISFWVSQEFDANFLNIQEVGVNEAENYVGRDREYDKNKAEAQFL